MSQLSSYLALFLFCSDVLQKQLLLKRGIKPLQYTPMKVTKSYSKEYETSEVFAFNLKV
jgi:hypothetical protein